MNPKTPVLVERNHPQLLFHDPTEVPTEIGMVTKLVRDAVADGIEPCSRCYGGNADTPATLEVTLDD